MTKSREFARSLIEKARGDAYVLEKLVADPEAPRWVLGFHAQQAAEKAIKAVLSAQGVEYPAIHDLRRLLALLRDARIPVPPEPERLVALTPFSAMFRYEEPGEDDLNGPMEGNSQIRELAVQTIRWAESLLDR